MRSSPFSTLALSFNPSRTGQAVSFTATLAGAVNQPTGTLQFKIDVVDFGSAVTLSGGAATSPLKSDLAAGAHLIQAFYSGDGNTLSAASAGAVQAVGYGVTYDANGATSGAVPVDDKVYGHGSTVIVLGNTGGLDRTGYTFNDWNTAAVGSGAGYAPSATFSITEPTTLYAQWTANTYTITFDSNGGSPVADITQLYGSPVTAPADPTRPGFTFAGWNPAIPVTMPLGGAALTAQWTANTYIVTFDSNGGGTPAPVTKTVTFGSVYGTLASVSRTGYTFNGWYTATSGGGLVTTATIVSTAANHTLYARWAANTYTLTVATTGNGSGIVTPTIGVHPYDYGTVVTLAATAAADSAFAGWSGDADCADGSVTMNGHKACTATFILSQIQLTLTAQPDNLYANGLDKALLTVSATDQAGHGAPFAGRPVTLTLDPGRGSLSAANLTLGANGIATATYTAGIVPGTAHITTTIAEGGGARIATAEVELQSNPLVGQLSSIFRGELITYTFVVTNAGGGPQMVVMNGSDLQAQGMIGGGPQTVVMSGSIPAKTAFVSVVGGTHSSTGGDYGAGYVYAGGITLNAGEHHTLVWSVRVLTLVGNIVNQARANSAEARLHQTTTNRIYRVLMPLTFKDYRLSP